MLPRHAFWSAILLLGAFPFGEPDQPSGPPPGMGDQVGSMQLIKEPAGLKEMVNSPIVSLIMFTEGDEESNEVKWFYLFAMIVERSMNEANGDARVNWGLVDNIMLRKSGSSYEPGSSFYQARPAGIWLFCDPSDDSGVKLPMGVQSQEDVITAGNFILGALASAKADNVKAIWHKRKLGSRREPSSESQEQERRSELKSEL